MINVCSIFSCNVTLFTCATQELVIFIWQYMRFAFGWKLCMDGDRKKQEHVFQRETR